MMDKHVTTILYQLQEDRETGMNLKLGTEK